MEFQKNDLVELTITDMDNEGMGIGKTNGYTLFVKDTVPGDVIEAVITKCKKNYGYGRLMKLLTASPYRVEPKCEHHKVCGGCQLQAISYEKQLEFKQNKVRNNLIRLGGFSEEEIDALMEPIVGMEEPFRYRNKAQFPFGKDKQGNTVTGFYAARSHQIVPNTDCILGVEENKEILEIILETMKETGVTPYDEATGKGILRHVLIRYGFVTGEIMVCFVINAKKLPAAEVFVGKLCKLKGMTSISVNYNMKNTNVIMGDEGKTLWGQDYITDYIGEIKYQISPLSFYQVNPAQTKKMYEKALEFAGLTGKETVWDLYCGIGTISLFLAKKAKKVYGVEIVPQAIEDARNNAKINGITNATFFVGKAEEVVPEFYGRGVGANGEGTESGSAVSAGEANVTGTESGSAVSTGEAKKDEDMRHPDVIVVDPPRKGCDEALLSTIVEMGPERLVYVSCDSATLARDLKFLAGNGFKLEKVQAFDNFCMGSHVETVCLLSKK